MSAKGGRPAIDQRWATAAVLAHSRGVGCESQRGQHRGGTDVAFNSGHAVSHVEGCGASVEHQCGIQHIGFAVDGPGVCLGRRQQRHDQRKGDAQSYHDQQGSPTGPLLLFDSYL